MSRVGFDKPGRGSRDISYKYNFALESLHAGSPAFRAHTMLGQHWVSVHPRVFSDTFCKSISCGTCVSYQEQCPCAVLSSEGTREEPGILQIWEDPASFCGDTNPRFLHTPPMTSSSLCLSYENSAHWPDQVKSSIGSKMDKR